MTDELPIISMAGLGDPVAEAGIARALDDTFRRTGFCYFRDIGVAPSTVAAAFAASRQFHALPDAAKRGLAMNDFHRGYMAPNTSVIRTSTVAEVKRPNFSESLMIMHEVAPDDPHHGQPLHGPNQYPDLPGFRAAVQAYDTAMRGFCQRLLRPLALALELPPDALAAAFAYPTTFLRLLHYPPQPPDSPDDAFGSAPHTDYGCITVLAQDNAGGLEVRRADGTWLQAPPVPGTWVVNVADMLSRWTNGRWQSTPHRVKNLSGTDRYSIPYFFDMDMDARVACLSSCTDAAHPPLHPPVRYGDYLMERLDRNYQYRQPAAAPAG